MSQVVLCINYYYSLSFIIYNPNITDTLIGSIAKQIDSKTLENNGVFQIR